MNHWLDKMPEKYRDSVRIAVKQALTEDIGGGDLTTLGTIPIGSTGKGTFTVKSAGVVAGLAVAGCVFQELDSTLLLVPLVTDGDRVCAGTVIATIEGPAAAILSGERTALNFLQHMSGVATYTSKMAEKIAHTHSRLFDTRKTTPGLRLIEKWAVALGGGTNHRLGLFDMALIKENHIAMAEGIHNAVTRMRRFLTERGLDGEIKIEVEVKSLPELKEALKENVDRILLDNMTVRHLRQAVDLAGGAIPLEASGNITSETVSDVAETGVDFISCGALTHSVTALDISFLLSLKAMQ